MTLSPTLSRNSGPGMPGVVQMVKEAFEQLLNVIACVGGDPMPLPISTSASSATIQVSMPSLGLLFLSSTCGTTYGLPPVVACANWLPDTHSMNPKTPTRYVFHLLTFTTFTESPDTTCAMVHLPCAVTNFC